MKRCARCGDFLVPLRDVAQTWVGRSDQVSDCKEAYSIPAPPDLTTAEREDWNDVWHIPVEADMPPTLNDTEVVMTWLET